MDWDSAFLGSYANYFREVFPSLVDSYFLISYVPYWIPAFWMILLAWLNTSVGFLYLGIEGTLFLINYFPIKTDGFELDGMLFASVSGFFDYRFIEKCLFYEGFMLFKLPIN